MKKKTRLAFASALACAAAGAQAEEHFNCNGGWRYWPTDPQFEIEEDDFTAAQLTDIEAAFTEFNLVAGLGRSVTTTREDNDPTANVRDGTNQVFDVAMSNLIGRARFSTSTDCTGSDSTYDEVDIYLDTGDPISTNGFTFSSNQFTYKLLTMHELGHALGLAHEFDLATVMKNRIRNAGDMGSRETYHSDDRRGFYDNYSFSGADSETNAAGTAYWTPAGSGQPLYDFDVMTQSSSFLINGAPNRAPATLNRGSSYRIPYTLENHSTQTRDVRARFYASTNNIISTSDEYLGQVLFTMGPRTEHTSSHFFTLPNSTPVDSTTSFGYVVDLPSYSGIETSTFDNTVRFERIHAVN